MEEQRNWRLEWLRGHRDHLQEVRDEKHEAYLFYKQYRSCNAAEYKQHIKEYDAAIARLDSKIAKQVSQCNMNCQRTDQAPHPPSCRSIS
ncbi:hypothetical protein [Yaravirus sp. 'brasiliensis']|uniref:Uncharacterized protein n=1 Tax=Yaravirus sp. 'brasiliensis' TaxID=2739681 RepID=A0AAE7B7V4_9VIRU|nr:hypothetical protein QKS73_gp29 [Yaravirus brasiliensis]QKE44402.1 hypothetical protein [Yaravirus brasiliensis]